MEATTEAATLPDDGLANVEIAAQFLNAIFGESDTVLFRPIETWNESGKKRSRVDYRNTCYRKAVPSLLKLVVLQLLRVADQERLNIFFGVCPRAGNKQVRSGVADSDSACALDRHRSCHRRRGSRPHQ
jgi:hypothetical protein